MNLIFSVLCAFPLGFFVKQRGLAIVTYLALDATLFAYQTLNVLHDDWLRPDGRLVLTNGDLLSYGVANATVIAAGVGLVVIGNVVAARRAARNNAISVA